MKKTGLLILMLLFSTLAFGGTAPDTRISDNNGNVATVTSDGRQAVGIMGVTSTDTVVVSRDGAIIARSQWNYTPIRSANTTTIKTGSGVLHAITVNTKATGAGSGLTVYDATVVGGGPTFASIDTVNLSGTFIYDANFNTGLTIRNTGVTTSADTTIVWI